MSTEYLNYEDAKFSKSRGVGVFGNDAQVQSQSLSIFILQHHFCCNIAHCYLFRTLEYLRMFGDST